MTILYDNLDINRDILLDLPFREGRGIITQDMAKPHHPVTLVGTPSWSALDSGKMALELGGWGSGDYAQCLAADCTDLDFTSEDFSIGGWFQWENTVEDSHILIARYELSVGGWEVYLTEAGALRYLSLRLHHAAGATLRTGAFSLGWNYDTLWHFGISRSGNSALFYRNGVVVDTTSDVLIDPETCNQDLVIGIRYTKNANYLKGLLPHLRAWGRALSADDWLAQYERELRWYS